MAKTIFLAAWAGLVLLTGGFGLRAAAVPLAALTPEGVEWFEKRIRPLLVERCYECHSAEGKKIKGGLRLDARELVLQGGDSGPALVPGNPEKSLLIKAIRYLDKDLQMPPKHALSPAQIGDLEKWVKMGAPDPRTNRVASLNVQTTTNLHWSFQPLQNPPLPPIKTLRWPNNAIDYFILAKLEAKELTPNFAADKWTLIRRATFDLTGLPPTPEEIDAFLRDHSRDAFGKVVDRLLALPTYGERWGRYWLDVARYADTAGESADYPIPEAYKYRNYVIQSFNADKPYDQFVREQVAGDLLPSHTEAEKHERIIATGFLAMARRFGVDPENSQHLTIEDTIDTLGRTVLGLSLSCARCHDHKYDPIPTQDYYALYGIFNSTRYPFPGSENSRKQSDFVLLTPPAQLETAQKIYQEQLAVADVEISLLEKKSEALEKKNAQSSTNGTPSALQEEEQMDRALGVAKKKRIILLAQPPVIEKAYAVAEGKPGNAKVQKRGDPSNLGEEVPRHFLKVLGGQALPKEETGSGRRELAEWLTAPGNPLTARVMVNRIWQHHFGKGLVSTPSDFGNRGLPPTHPELLDFLTRRFVESGWSIKAMHKFIMLSQTYQQASVDSVAGLTLDPNNKWHWKFERQRLEAEAIRDTMLSLSEDLDQSAGGPHPFPPENKWSFTQHKQFTAVYESNLRSVYLMQQRIKKHPFLAIFDGADANASTAERAVSTTPLQALFMMNDPFTHGQAAKFANRLARECPDETCRIRLAYQLAYGRAARPEEVRDGLSYLNEFRAKLKRMGIQRDQFSQLSWESYARALYGSNEFIFLD